MASLTTSGNWETDFQMFSPNISLPSFQSLDTSMQKAAKGIIGDHIHDLIQYVVDLWICSILCYAGIVDNILAMIVFAKMGFQNTINISMLSIAFWDVVKCLSGAIVRLYGPIQLFSEAEAISWKNLSNVTFGYMYVLSGFVSGVLAAYVAVERCLCVSLPFTVKFLLTRKTVMVTSLIIPVTVFAFHGAVYSIVSYKYVFSPRFNTTIAVFTYTSTFYKYPVIDVYTSIMSMLSPMFTFSVMIVCTIMISFFLTKASLVRHSVKEAPMTSESKTNRMSARDRQVIKMLLIVVVVYILTYIPKLIMYLTTLLVPEFRPNGLYSNEKWISLYAMFLFDFINSIANPIIFFFMSSSFKSTFLTMIGISTSKQ